MIEITTAADCCGCEACVQACPRSCITMQRDEKGFLYPKADKNQCVDCGLCEKVCPNINVNESRQPIQIIASKNPDESERRDSSSGGFFLMLAKWFIQHGGVVFGVAFDTEWMPVHCYAESFQELKKFQRSKYVQSRIDGSYVKAKSFLEAGRKVLFSGTPCQISGLRLFLRKDYDNLMTVEVICHGVPSPGVWRAYLNHEFLSDGKTRITGINFRDKISGWRNYHFSITWQHIDSAEKIELSQVFYENVFMQAFLNNYILRPSCFRCKAKMGRSKADFSVGDFWGIENYETGLDDDMGVTLVYINTGKAQDFYHHIQSTGDVELNPAVHYNEMYYDSVIEKYPAGKFWNAYKKQGLACVPAINKKLQPSRCRRLLTTLKNKLAALFKR